MNDPDRDALIRELERPLIPYYMALGRFLSAYSNAEANILVALGMCSKVSNEVRQSIFSGTRAQGALEYIRRISEAEKWTKKQREPYDIIFEQFGVITRVRNDILHLGVESVGTGEWYTTNAFVAHVPNRLRETRITPAILNNLAIDCMKVSAHAVMIGSIPNPDYERVVSSILASAWQYKPEPPVRRQKRSPSKPQTQKPPPQSSRE